MVINSKLHSVCEESVKEGLKFLKSEASKIDYKREYEVITGNLDSLLALPSVTQLTHTLEGISALTRQINRLMTSSSPTGLHDAIERFFVERFFLRYLGFLEDIEKTNFKFVKRRFSSLYFDLEKYIYGKADYVYICPVYNLQMKEKSVLINEITIRRMTKKDYFDLFRMSELDLQINAISFGFPPQFLIEIKSNKLGKGKYQKKIQDFIHAYSLFKSEAIQIRGIKTIMPKFYPVELTGSEQVLLRRGSANKFSKLHKSQIPPLRKFFRAYQKIKKNSQLETAIKRFQFGLESINIEDIVLDFVISLECLYGEDRATTRAISERTALLLGRTDSETDKLRKDVSGIYKIRSAIVHGGNLNAAYSKTNLTEDQVKQKLEEITNKSLLAYLKLIRKGEKFHEIKNKLDTFISYKSKRKRFQKKAGVII